MSKLPLLVLLALPARASEPVNPAVEEAFQKMYSFNFAGAQQTIDHYIAAQPSDPLGYSVRASTFLFSELDRMGILESEFFENDKRISDSRKKIKPDPRVHDEFYAATTKAEALAQAALDKNPKDSHALFAKSLTLGEMVDYIALVEKKQIASLSVNKRSYREAKHLLEIDPSYTDAYLTTGFTEYLVGTLPVVVRWFVKFDDVQGNKQQGFSNLERVAKGGRYLKSLAKVLLAAGYLREKRLPDAQKELADLTHEYPANPLFKREYDKISARLHIGAPRGQ